MLVDCRVSKNVGLTKPEREMPKTGGLASCWAAAGSAAAAQSERQGNGEGCDRSSAVRHGHPPGRTGVRPYSGIIAAGEGMSNL